MNICHSRYRGPLRALGMAVALACSQRAGLAIDPNRNITQYVSESWGPDRDFPQGPVYSIAQTSDGYLWIGTEKGLVRFDGLNFQLEQPADPNLPRLSHVLGLIADSDGSLWARLRRPSVVHYRQGKFDDVTGVLGREDSTVAAMARSRDGGLLLWVLNSEGTAIVVKEGKPEILGTPHAFSRSPVLAIAQTSNGDVFVGTRDAGLFRITAGKFFAVSEGLPDTKVNALVPVNGNQLWVGTDSGIVRWDGTRLTSAGIPHSLDGIQALALAVDHDSNLWIGSNSRGLLRLNAHGVESRALPPGSTVDAVTAIFEDREGNLWIGSASGLERLRDSVFISYSLPEGLPSDGSNPVYVDAGNRVWFSPVSGGLWWMKDGQHGVVKSGGLENDRVYSITGGMDADREIWVGRQRGGLTRVDAGAQAIATRTYTHADGLAQDSVYSVYRSRDGAVWAGTLSGGVSRLAGGRFVHYTTADGLASNTVNAILEAADGTMWFATPAGLSTLSNGHWSTYLADEGLPSADVNCLLEDSARVIWASTAAGLAYREEGKFHGLHEPRLHEQILGMAEDKEGSLWLATASHVLRVSRDKLLSGLPGDEGLREFGLADGLRGTEGVKRFLSVVPGPAGTIWFSLNRGLSMVDPSRLKRNAAPAIPHIQTVSADGKAISFSESFSQAGKAPARIPGGMKRIAFGFSGLGLSVPERARFRYMLEGFDRNWSSPVASAEAVYTNLLPGTYKFRLIASNPDGAWSGTEAAIALEVEPQFWQTWWFRVLCFVMSSSAVIALYRFRLRDMTKQLSVRFEERLAERTRIAQELHDTLLQGFISASMQVHVGVDRLPADSSAKPMLTRALELMGQVLEEGRNAVQGLRSTPNPSLDLEQAFSRIQQEMIPQDKSIEQVAFRVVVEGQPRTLHPVLRDEVYRIGREALINAFRHARADSIELELRYSSNQLRMLVRDNGAGIDPQVLRAGRDGHFGLSGMRERADRIGARLHVFSSISAGTEIELSVPGHAAFQRQTKAEEKLAGSGKQ